MQIKPLSDVTRTVEEKFPWWRFYEPSLEIPKAQNAQLDIRPDVWDLGLWIDPQEERIAKTFASICENSGLVARAAFIPDDPMNVIDLAGIGCGGLLAGVMPLFERACRCKIGFKELNEDPSMSFRQFVRLVKERVSVFPPAPEPRRRKDIPKGDQNWRMGWFTFLFPSLIYLFVAFVVYVIWQVRRLPCREWVVYPLWAVMIGIPVFRHGLVWAIRRGVCYVFPAGVLALLAVGKIPDTGLYALVISMF